MSGDYLKVSTYSAQDASQLIAYKLLTQQKTAESADSKDSARLLGLLVNKLNSFEPIKSFPRGVVQAWTQTLDDAKGIELVEYVVQIAGARLMAMSKRLSSLRRARASDSKQPVRVVAMYYTAADALLGGHDTELLLFPTYPDAETILEKMKINFEFTKMLRDVTDNQELLIAICRPNASSWSAFILRYATPETVEWQKALPKPRTFDDGCKLNSIVSRVTMSKDTKPKQFICHFGCVGSVKRCAGCKLVHYCSDACQLQHWPLHKPLCKSKS